MQKKIKKPKSNLSIFIQNYYKNLIYEKPKLHILNILLKFLSFFYIFFVFVRKLFYKIKFFKTFKFKETFVISVGNVTTGGTGKTPIVLKIIDILKKNNLQNYENIAVISRGYKRKIKNIKILPPNKNLFEIEEIGDEPCMIKERIPEIFLGIGANRAKVIEKILSQSNYKIKYLILDDGFQKISIYKNLNILLIDASTKFSIFEDFVLPRGNLREPIKNISKADLIILTKTNLAKNYKLESNIKNLENFGFSKKNKNLVFSKYIPSHFVNMKNFRINIENLKKNNISVTLLSGIGNPDSFEKTIKNLGFNISQKHFFNDHYWFGKKDLELILETKDLIFTTEKDFVKLKKLIFKENINFSITDFSKIYCLIMDVVFDETLKF